MLMMRHYPDLGSASDWLKQISHTAQPYHKHYPDLDSDASSVQNFCIHFLDVISQGNHWWRRKMSAVFSG